MHSRSASPMFQHSSYSIPPRKSRSIRGEGGEDDRSQYDTDFDLEGEEEGQEKQGGHESMVYFEANPEADSGRFSIAPRFEEKEKRGRKEGEHHGRKKSEVSFVSKHGKRNFSRPFNVARQGEEEAREEASGLPYTNQVPSPKSEYTTVNNSLSNSPQPSPRFRPMQLERNPSQISQNSYLMNSPASLQSAPLQRNSSQNSEHSTFRSPSIVHPQLPVRDNSFTLSTQSQSTTQPIRNNSLPTSPPRENQPSQPIRNNSFPTSPNGQTPSHPVSLSLNRPRMLKPQRSYLSTDGSDDDAMMRRRDSNTSSRSGSSAGGSSGRWKLFGKNKNNEGEDWKDMDKGEDEVEELEDGQGGGGSRSINTDRIKRTLENIQRESIYSNYSFYELPSPDQDVLVTPSSLPPPTQPHTRNVSFSPSPTIVKTSHSHPKSQPLIPSTASEFLSMGIEFHEQGELERSAWCFERSAKVEGGIGSGMLLWGLSLRHGWGVGKNEELGTRWIQKVVEGRVKDGVGKGESGKEEKRVEKNELILGLLELGNSFAYGWGVRKDKKMVSFFKFF
jgi:hypothetical protein